VYIFVVRVPSWVSWAPPVCSVGSLWGCCSVVAVWSLSWLRVVCSRFVGFLRACLFGLSVGCSVFFGVGLCLLLLRALRRLFLLLLLFLLVVLVLPLRLFLFVALGSLGLLLFVPLGLLVLPLLLRSCRLRLVRLRFGFGSLVLPLRLFVWLVRFRLRLLPCWLVRFLPLVARVFPCFLWLLRVPLVLLRLATFVVLRLRVLVRLLLLPLVRSLRRLCLRRSLLLAFGLAWGSFGFGLFFGGRPLRASSVLSWVWLAALGLPIPYL